MEKIKGLTYGNISFKKTNMRNVFTVVGSGKNTLVKIGERVKVIDTMLGVTEGELTNVVSDDNIIALEIDNETVISDKMCEVVMILE